MRPAARQGPSAPGSKICRDFAESTSKTDSFYNILGSLDQAALPFTVLLQRTKIVQYTGIQTVFCEY